jgi:hypothetical protein
MRNLKTDVEPQILCTNINPLLGEPLQKIV